MFSFQTRSYFEGIKNAVCGVDFVPREWDIWNADETIILIVEKIAKRKTKDCSPVNAWYEEVKELGILAERIQTYYDYEDWEEEKKDQERFGELLGRNINHLWL